MSRFLSVALLALVALLASACSRATTLGPEEAVEVMVLEGVDRSRALCVVRILDGQLELAKIAGITVDLTEEELALLSTTSSVCAPAYGTGGGVLGGSSDLTEAMVAQQNAAARTREDLDSEVFALVDAGLDRSIALCLVSKLRVIDDPQEVLDDVAELARFIVDCREELEADGLAPAGAVP